jgi:hypothetical protein
MEIGPKDHRQESGGARAARYQRETFVTQDGLAQTVLQMLSAIQKGLFEKALAFREKNSREVDDYPEFQHAARCRRFSVVALVRRGRL